MTAPDVYTVSWLHTPNPFYGYRIPRSAMCLDLDAAEELQALLGGPDEAIIHSQVDPAGEVPNVA
jgi:hypothetical protein